MGASIRSQGRNARRRGSHRAPQHDGWHVHHCTIALSAQANTVGVEERGGPENESWAKE